MKIWLLDDAHFPSGQATGKMADVPAELCKQYLNYKVADVCGPVKQVTLNVAAMAHYEENIMAVKSIFAEKNKREFTDGYLMAVIASRLDGKEGDIYHMDDPRNISNMQMRLVEMGIPFEAHLFQAGNHGDGLYDGKPSWQASIRASFGSCRASSLSEYTLDCRIIS